MKASTPPYRVFCPGSGILDNCIDSSASSAGHLAKSDFDVLQWSPSNSTHSKNINLVCVHAFGLSARAFSALGENLSTRGYEVLASDLRGFGERRGQEGYHRVDFRVCLADLRALLEYLRISQPEAKTVLVGESMGGAVVIRLAAEVPDLVDAVIASAPAWRIFQVPGITARGLVDRVVGEPGFASEWVIKRATSCDELRHYWKHGGRTRLTLTIKEAYRYLRLMQATPDHAAKIRTLPTLIIQGLYDRLSKPLASAGLLNRLSTPDKQLMIAAACEHLVLEENQLSQKVVEFIDSWLDYHLLGLGAPVRREPVVVLGRGELSEEDRNRVNKLVKAAGVGKSQAVPVF